MSHLTNATSGSVCHISTVHPRKDVRIFHKECKSLVSAGYKVSLIVNDGLGEMEEEAVHFIDLGGLQTRFKRMFFALPLAWWQARKLNQDIYHVHDPELMLVALALTLEGRSVIYDVHEDLPNDIRNKPWIPRWLQTPVSKLMAQIEKFVGTRISACVCTTPHIAQRFESYGGTVELLRNFPEIGEDIHRASDNILDKPVQNLRPNELSQSGDVSLDSERNESAKIFRLVFAGTISKNRGIVEMVEAVHRAGCRLVLMGVFREPEVYQMLSESAAWKSVDYLGVVSKARVETEYNHCHAGITYYYPNENYVNALPIKLYEYMRYRLPVICSDFDTWRDIYESTDACLFVEPCNVDKLREAILKLKNNPRQACAMGESGHAVVVSQYNWESEFSKLEKLYCHLVTKKTFQTNK